MPLQGEKEREAFLKHATTQIKEAIELFVVDFSGKQCTPDFQSFVLSMLATDPASRPTAEELLQHPFLQA